MLVVSQYVEQLYARELLSQGTGGVGYLLKDRISDVAQFIDAVHRVAGGGTAMDPEVIGALLSRHRDNSPIASLTPREHEVLSLLARGMPNKAIANALAISNATAKNHVHNILEKLRLHRRSEVAALLRETPRRREQTALLR